jgi:hypothetical protein
MQEQSSPSAHTHERRPSIFNNETNGNPISMVDNTSVRRLSLIPTPNISRLESKDQRTVGPRPGS